MRKNLVSPLGDWRGHAQPRSLKVAQNDAISGEIYKGLTDRAELDDLAEG